MIEDILFKRIHNEIIKWPSYYIDWLSEEGNRTVQIKRGLSTEKGTESA